MRLDLGAFQGLPLMAHQVMAGVTLVDAWSVCLDRDTTVPDLRRVEQAFNLEELVENQPVLRFFFRLREWLGRRFGWDEVVRKEVSAFVKRVPRELRVNEIGDPVESSGNFIALYDLQHEKLAEIRNKTVHAFVLSASQRIGDENHFVLAAYVVPVNRWTAWYMAMINPFRR